MGDSFTEMWTINYRDSGYHEHKGIFSDPAVLSRLIYIFLY